MDTRPADSILSPRKLMCAEKAVPILMRMETAFVSTASLAKKTAHTGIRIPAEAVTATIIPAAVMADTADADTALFYIISSTEENAAFLECSRCLLMEDAASSIRSSKMQSMISICSPAAV